MRKSTLILLLLSIGLSGFSQELIFGLMDRTDLRLSDIEQRANRYFDSAGTGRGTGYKQFQRWLYERKFHTDENGQYVSPVREWNNYLIGVSRMDQARAAAANWTELGPWSWNRTTSWNPGTGRLSALAIHPSNEQVIFAGSPGGGLWRSTNGGTNWQPLTDNNSNWMSIFAITIDPANQNVIYVGTSGAGILKSVDGGNTLAPAGSGPGGTVRKILIHPSNTNTVFAACSNGIWRSVNAGASWTLVHSGSKEDIEFKPDNMNIMYATGNDVYRSVDNGVTWTAVGATEGITATGRTLVSVTPANPNYVYVVQASGSLFGRLYKSTDGGLSFSTVVVGDPAAGTNYFGYETNGTGTTGQATYDMAMDVSPVNAAEVYIGGIIVFKSVNEGLTFIAKTAWSYPNSVGYNHADVHGLFWVNNTLYSISDGGLFKSTNAGDNWVDLSAGMGIRQFYRMANSPTNPTVITGGAQDNGSAVRQASGTWADWLGADGMEGLVSPTNHLNLWGTSQNGSIYRSTNGGNSYSGLTKPSNGQWVTPLAIHPTNETILYGGWTGVYKSINSGSTWTNISSGVITTTLADLAVAPSDPNYIYASNGNILYVTTDDGANWNIRTAPATINDIAVDPVNPAKIWIACNSSSNRLYVSTDAGATFTNISTGLPAIVARAVVVDDNTPRGIYVGMNVGVYYKTESDANWTNYTANLPLVAINELEIQKTAGKIRVATYGRGIWESPVADVAPPGGFSFTNPAPAITACPAPATMSVTLGSNSVGGFTNPITLAATAGIPAGTSISFGSNPLSPGNSSLVTLNNSNTLAPGTYTVTITGTATGAAAQTRDIVFTINPGIGPVISAQPANQTVCSGTNTSFTISSAATGYQWQLSTDGGTTFSNLSNGGIYAGTSTATLSLTGVSAAVQNYRYRCIASTSCGSTASAAATLTVNQPPVITGQPADATVCAGSNQTFTVTATGTNTTYQWEISTDGGTTYTAISGAVNASLNLNAITASMNGNRYRCRVTAICTPVAVSAAALLTVLTPVTITAQPQNAERCAGTNAVFSITGNGSGLVYQWQSSSDGGTTWTNISGAGTATLSLNAVTTAISGTRYRCLISNTICTSPVISGTALLTVRALPVLSLAAAPRNSLLPGQTTTLTATAGASTGGTLSTNWSYNGTDFTNAANTWPVNVEKTGNYQVRIQETFPSGLACSNQSELVTISAAASSKLFIFPSPNNGSFTVAYYNSSGTANQRTVTIYDSKGARVYNARFPVNGPYTLIPIDITPAQRGVYYVVVGDNLGKKLAEGKVLVQ